MRLGGDVGGTKTLLEARAGAFTLLRRRYDNDAYASFDALLADFLADVRAHHRAAVTSACFAVAGPVEGGAARLTNRLDWALEADLLAVRHGLERVKLVNDFVGLTAGLLELQSEETRELQSGRRLPEAPLLVVGPGTGCGVGVLVDGQPVPSEGGHAAFAPFDAESLALWQALGGPAQRVTAEDVLSGRGLLACYLAIAGGGSTPVASPAEVTTLAEAGEPGAMRAVRLFARCLGSFAGDFALTLLSRGGVYVAGGIPPRLPPALFDAEFLRAFLAKGVYAELATHFPVSLVLAQDLGLRGALRLATPPGEGIRPRN